jgi:hypothetical protein
MNGANSVAAIVVASQQHFSFRLAQFVFESLKQRLQLFNRRLVFFGKLKEHSRVVDLRLKVFLTLNLLFEPAAILQQFLRGFLVGPEIRRRGLRFDPVQLVTPCRNIKETSRAGLRAHGGCQTKLSIPGSIEAHSSN